MSFEVFRSFAKWHPPKEKCLFPFYEFLLFCVKIGLILHQEALPLSSQTR
jgi:hypothetical protein